MISSEVSRAKRVRLGVLSTFVGTLVVFTGVSPANAQLPTLPSTSKIVAAPCGSEMGPDAAVKGNQPPTLCRLAEPWPGDSATGSSAPADTWDDTFAAAKVGQAWSGQVDVVDADDTVFHWQLMSAPVGLVLADTSVVMLDEGGNHHAIATLKWMPDGKVPANTMVRLRVVDGHGNATTRTFHLAVEGGYHTPVLAPIANVDLTEGEAWSMPVRVADADGDMLTIHVGHMPHGAHFDASSNVLSWIPDYDQAGTYNGVTISVSDGLTTVRRRFDIVVAQAQPAAILPELPLQTVHAGQAFAMQLPGHLPDHLTLAKGETVKLTYFAPLPPVGMQIDDAGKLTWTPDASQVGHHAFDVDLKTIYDSPDGTVARHVTKRTLFFDVLRANAAPMAGPVRPAAPRGDHAFIALTHTDLALHIPLAAFFHGSDGDIPSWRVIGALHGSAKPNADHRSIIFTPSRGYSGPAALTVVADDGHARNVPITLPITVSGSALTAIHLAPLTNVEVGQSASVVAMLDFVDQQNVDVSADPAYLHLSLVDLKTLHHDGKRGVEIDDEHDRLHFAAAGPALLAASHVDADGHILRALRAFNVWPAPAVESMSMNDASFDGDANQDRLPVVVPRVHPGIAVPLGDDRQLHVQIIDPNSGSIVAVSPVPTRHPRRTGGAHYLTSNANVATVDGDGLITPHAAGMATISVLYLYSDNPSWLGADVHPTMTLGQSGVSVLVEHVQMVDEDSSTRASYQTRILAKRGGIIGDTAGDVVMVAPGALGADAEVAIQHLDVTHLAAVMDVPLPGPGVLQALAAFHVDFGGVSIKFPMHFEVPIQTGRVEPGEQVVLLRRHTVMVPTPEGDNGSRSHGTRPSWWLVGTAHLGSDGKLHSDEHSPYGGFTDSGDYVLGRIIPTSVRGSANIKIGRGDWVTFDGLHISLGASVNQSTTVYGGTVMAALLNAAKGLSLGGYHYGRSTFRHISAPKVPPVGSATIDLEVIRPRGSALPGH